MKGYGNIKVKNPFEDFCWAKSQPWEKQNFHWMLYNAQIKIHEIGLADGWIMKIIYTINNVPVEQITGLF